MPVYVVTGKLGAGKSLTSVGRIAQYLYAGRKVATNLNIYLPAILGRNKRKTRLYRVPDKPNLHDLEALGRGNNSYDETKNGLLVLDECGTWFNSRTWNDKTRQPMINWCLHARKLGWDIIFIIQDESLIDKQARLALAEHVVTCMRTDRINIPILGTVYKLFTGNKIPLPRVHIGTVKYGNTQSRMVVDRWTTIGTSLYHAYDTKQSFSDHYEHGTYTVLPTWYTHKRNEKPLTLGRFMRLTKIYFKKFSRIQMSLFGAAFSAFVCWIYVSQNYQPIPKETDKQAVEVVNEVKALEAGSIIRYVELPNSRPDFTVDIGGDYYDFQRFINSGYNVQFESYCNVKVFNKDTTKNYYC